MYTGSHTKMSLISMRSFEYAALGALPFSHREAIPLAFHRLRAQKFRLGLRAAHQSGRKEERPLRTHGQTRTKARRPAASG